MAIDDATVRHIAALAQLDLDDADVPRFGRQLDAIVGYVAQIAELDVEGVPPLAHPGSGSGALRPDEPVPSLPLDEATAGAPESWAGFFRVPRVLKG